MDFVPDTIARSLDRENPGMMNQPVNNGRRHDRVGKDLSPVFEPVVAGQKDRSFLVTDGDQLKEQVGLFPGNRGVSDLVDDQDMVPGICQEARRQGAVPDRQRQIPQESGEGEEQNALFGLAGLDADRHGQMCFPDARRSKENKILGLLQKVERSQADQGFFLQGGLERKVELLQGAEEREPGQSYFGADRPVGLSPGFFIQKKSQVFLVLELVLGRFFGQRAVKVDQSL